jgi:inhibitor of KinA sporulation pathway (predicted exonuclease)
VTFLNGLIVIDDLHLYNRPLTTPEISDSCNPLASGRP